MNSSRRLSWLTLFLILLFSGTIVAQKSEYDKLRNQISKETNDTSKIKLLIQMRQFFIMNDSQDQDKCLREAYNLSKKTKFPYGLAWNQYYEGQLLIKEYRWNEAIEKYKKATDMMDSLHIIQYVGGYPLLSIRVLFNAAIKQEDKFKYYSDKVVFYKRHGPIENLANCFHGIGGYYSFYANYDKAIEYYLRARESYKTFDSFGYANENQAIGSMYLEWGNLDKAEVYLKSALKDLIRMKKNCFYSYHQLGDLNFKRHEYKRALGYYFKGKKFCNFQVTKLINLLNCAAAHIALNSNDSARFYLDRVEKITKNESWILAQPMGDIEVDYTFYSYYVATGNNRLAAQHLKAALFKARSEKVLPLLLKYTNELHSFLLKQGDSLQALRYLVQYNALQDSINKMNTQARIASFEIEQQQQAKENEIEHLHLQKKELRNYYLIGGVFLLLIVMAVISLILYRRKRDKEQLTSDFKNQLARAETKALRAQMNPHFIFNSLNSINNFVTDQKHEIASDYLLRFSKLIRLILDNSRSETIPLDKELETLQLYVQLESIRFENHFKYEVNIAENISTSSIMIPPMLLQPFIENAIWHGLMQKRTKGTITVDIRKENETFLNISITDDGIGREKAAEFKSKSATHRSHGLKVTSERIEMMNKLNSTGAHVNIIDLQDEQGHATGTKVELIIPY
jgi:hypothetical protein